MNAFPYPPPVVKINFTKLRYRLPIVLSAWEQLEHDVIFGNTGKVSSVRKTMHIAQSIPHPYIRAWMRLLASRKISLSGCWEWEGAINARTGYGEYYMGRKSWYVHRLSFFLSNGWYPVGNYAGVFHKCDNPPCFNPDHLWWGTTADNMKDKELKGRGRHKQSNQGGPRCDG